MIEEIIIAIVSAAVGALISGFFTVSIYKKKIIREDKENKKLEYKKMMENKPEFKITIFKNYIKMVGFGKNIKTDMEVFISQIIDIKTSYGMVYFEYDKSDLDEKNWCYILYEFQNIGKTDVSYVDIISNYKRDVSVFDRKNIKFYINNNLANYWVNYDYKIRVGEKFTLKVCFHKDRIIFPNITSLVCIGFKDSNGNYWRQPFFIPYDKLYESYNLDSRKYIEECSVEPIIEDFRKKC